MRRFLATLTLAVPLALGSASAASADHTGCEHQKTDQAHQSVPHYDNHGTHTAHSSVPYCPPEDAPR